MPEQIPTACSLNASDLRVRLADMAALGGAALLTVDRDGSTARLRFTAGEGIRARVDRIVTAEAECCPFLEMRVSTEPDVVLVEIVAPEDAEPVLDDLVAAFGAPAPAS